MSFVVVPPPPRPLTRRQALCVRLIAAHLSEHGRAPTLRELAAAMGTGINSVVGRLEILERKGWVEGRRGFRSLRLAGARLALSCTPDAAGSALGALLAEPKESP